MKSYTEKVTGIAPFAWRRFLVRAAFEEVFPRVRLEAGKVAGNWTSCACGSQSAKIERQTDGEPIDKLLRNIGSKFFYAVACGAWVTALRDLDQIEARAKLLIAPKKRNRPLRRTELHPLAG